MTAGGWMFMLGSVISVASLALWCFVKVLTLPPAEDDSVKPPPAGT